MSFVVNMNFYVPVFKLSPGSSNELEIQKFARQPSPQKIFW